MGRNDDRIDVDLDDFVQIATRERWASADELAAFAEMWRLNFDAGTQGFGDESTIEDWQGGLEAWRAIRIFIGMARRTNWDLAEALESWLAAKGPMPDFRVVVEHTH